MTDPKQIIFDNGCSLLKEGDFVGFAEAIIEIHVNHSLCDCFFKGQPTSIWPFLLDITTLIGADDSFDTKGYDDDFHLNFSKGFLFLQIIDYNEAYYYLTRSIDAKALFDVSYNIRSRIPEKYNKGYLQDAVEAALLRGSATNYLTFANLVRNCESESVGGCLIKSSESFGIDKINARKLILIYNKILFLDKSFSCLYADKGLAHITL